MALKALAVGDSVVWGQGLAHKDKFVNLVYRELTGESLPEENIHARSGAVIGPIEGRYTDQDPATVTGDDKNLQKEIPHKRPLIEDQLNDLNTDSTIDVVFLDGGANDVELMVVGNPTTPQKKLEEKIKEYCYGRLKQMIALTQDKCPNATIIVSGYYPAITGDTPISQLGAISAGALGGALFGPIGLLSGSVIGYASTERIRHNVLFFHRRSLYWMRRAVAEKNADTSRPCSRVLFGHAGFTHQNGLYARDPWVFAPGDNDAKRSARKPVCEQLYPSDPLNREICINASMLHPNEAGAQAYARQISRRYKDGNDRPLRERLTELSTELPLYCREILEQYNLPVETGVQNCIDHFTVDTIRVTVSTGDNGTDSDIYLRMGENREWLLDQMFFDDPSDFNDFEANTVNSYTIDPVLDGEGGFLSLKEIEEITLVKRGLFDWKPTHISVELNGVTVFESDIETTLRGTDRWTGEYPRGLLIIKIQADAPGVPESEHLSDEYVVVANAGTRSRDLTGFSLDYSDGQIYDFPNGYTLNPGDEVTIRTGKGADTETDLYAGYRSPVLNNMGDIVTLRNDTGQTVARRVYGIH